MERLPVAGGYVTITDETVEADISVFKAFYRLFEQSKIGFGILAVAIVSALLIAVFDPSFRIPLGLATLILVAYVLLALLVNKVFRPHSTTEEVISREAIQLVAYKEQGKFRWSSFAIVYNDDGERKARNVFLTPDLMAGDEPLCRILPVFEKAGIETRPVDELEN